ncbi:MAG: hypothetical protein QG655_1229 [Actinomycetota bacterium]|jgi:hypothetical protein|nr:hypothetical protein [Actinomycetota bacterium]
MNITATTAATTPTGSRRSSRATHTLTNPYGNVWILTTARGQVIRAVHADGIDAAVAHAGPLGDEPHRHWLRRGPGRYIRTAAVPDSELLPKLDL